MPCKNRHEKNVPKHKKCSGTFSFIVREILIYLAPSQLVAGTCGRVPLAPASPLLKYVLCGKTERCLPKKAVPDSLSPGR